MKKTLVLAEKPSVGRDIARVLECKNDKNGYIEGSKYSNMGIRALSYIGRSRKLWSKV